MATATAATGNGSGVRVAKQPLKVLVVDDNLDAAQSLAMMLETAGYDAQWADGGRSGLAMVRRMSPDVILLDIGMPELDG